VWARRDVVERFRVFRAELSRRLGGERVTGTSALAFLLNLFERVDKISRGLGVDVGEIERALDIYIKVRSVASAEGVEPERFVDAAVEAYRYLKRLREVLQRKVSEQRPVNEDVVKRLVEVKK
jgi:hypothetical protein